LTAAEICISIGEALEAESHDSGLPVEDAMRTSDVAAVALGVMSVLLPGAAVAAELTVLAGMGVVSGVRDVAPAFERATGHKVIVSFEAGPSLMQKVTSNAPADLVVHYPEAIDDLIRQGRVVGSRVDFARAGVGVAVKAGAPKPDISTPEASSAPCSPPSRSPIRAPARAASLRQS
jgi:ABC-type molybdate transport system substrate-binding protein